jgi:pimeloyl-ACP methyl ester carboxylesterase
MKDSSLMRRTAISLVVALVSLLPATAAHAGWRDYVSPSKNWQRMKDCTAAVSHRVTTYCRDKVDRAKSDQAKMWGLKLPADFDPDRPLVILIHGLDSDDGVWDGMATLLRGQHYQVGYFGFPSDGPIRDDAARLADEMAALHRAFPRVHVDLVGHSMGALIARAYIEGDRYTHPVDHFVAIGPPNHGSPWTRGRWVLEAHEQYVLWRSNKDYSPIWMFTDGHGEAADDLKPSSEFLKQLNARPRRDGVKYTIVVGDHHVLSRFGQVALGAVEYHLSDRRWGVRFCRACLDQARLKLANQTCDSDGVVPIDSGRLDGVADVVRLHADHNTLAMAADGQPPAAWETVKARLRQ